MSPDQTNTVVNTPIGDTPVSRIEANKKQTPIHMSLQALLQPHKECSVMSTSCASCNHTVEPRVLDRTFQLMFVVRGVIDVVPSQPSHFNISNFCSKAMYLLKHVVVAYVTRPPRSMMTAPFTFEHQYGMEFLRALNNSR